MKKLTAVLAALMMFTIFDLTTYAMGSGMGGGMMGGGSGMGMHGGQGGGFQYGPQYDPQNKPQYRESQGPMEKRDAEELMENYLRSTRNPNLKLGKIEDKGDFFECEILTKDGSLVDKFGIDKERGSMRSIY